jgi:hypothetical protein
MSPWISAKDEVPDENRTVIIHLEDGEVWTGFLDAGVWRYVSGARVATGGVLHWMEFPEPPSAMETDLTGEIEEARELAHDAVCRRRDIEQGITALGEDEP